jgi:hypothetical protein
MYQKEKEKSEENAGRSVLVLLLLRPRCLARAYVQDFLAH